MAINDHKKLGVIKKTFVGYVCDVVWGLMASDEHEILEQTFHSWYE